MSQKRLSMRKIRALMRLKYELGRSHREIAASLGVANSTVSDYADRARAAGLSWPLPEGLDDAALEAALFPPLPPSRAVRPEPDWTGCTGIFSATRASRSGCCGWSTGRCIRTATDTAASATATGCGGGGGTWYCCGAYSDEVVHRFQAMPSTGSVGSCPVIPGEAGRR